MYLSFGNSKRKGKIMIDLIELKNRIENDKDHLNTSFRYNNCFKQDALMLIDNVIAGYEIDKCENFTDLMNKIYNGIKKFNNDNFTTISNTFKDKSFAGCYLCYNNELAEKYLTKNQKARYYNDTKDYDLLQIQGTSIYLGWLYHIFSHIDIAKNELK